MYKRALILFGLMMSLFCFSFFSLDLISNKNNFKDAASNQQSYKLRISDIRGTIYDCRNVPLVNVEKKLVAAVIPSVEALSALTPAVPECKKEELFKKCSGNTPFMIEIEKEVRSPWIKVFEVPIRYSGVTLAPHIIGYIFQAKIKIFA